MKHIYLFFIALFIGSLGYSQIISQYVETNSGTTPKGIEIWNNTGATLDFSTNSLVIEKGSNGGSPSTDFTLSTGTLASGDVIVIGTSDMETVTLANGSVFHEKAFTFNGDDALVVKYGGTITDMFGLAGSDPGSSWTGGGVDTRNNNIELNPGITTGDTDGWADPSTRFSTLNSNPSGTNGDEGFGIAPTLPASCTAPTTQAYAYYTTALGTTSATLNWTDGDGEEVLVVVKEGSAVDTDPTNGTDYTGSTVFGSGDDLELGTGNYAVYADLTTNSVDITGLSEATTYHVAVYEYNTTDTCYLTPALTGSFTTEIACPVITGLTIDSFTDTTANISWTPGDTETDWEVVIQDAGTGTPSGSGTATTTNNPYLASGLIQNTAYEVYVRANCVSDGFSTWAGPTTFTTEISCPEITGLTIDSFTDTTANISWTPGDTETDWEVVIQDAGTGTPSESGTATTTNNPYLASGLTQNTAYEVYVRANCVSDGLSTWAGPTTFTTEISCPEITGLTIDSFTDTTANISWTPGDIETNWEVVIQNAGTGTPSGSGTATTTNNPYLASGLTQNTAYEVYVRANCVSDGFSTWAGPITFTTEISCPEITGLTIDSFTDTTANISWTPGDTETSWEIVVQTSGTSTPSSGIPTSTNPHSWSGLTELTTYEVYVRANCVSDGFSTWAGPITFTTTCGAITPPYSANMEINVPDVCWKEAGSGEVNAGPGDIGESDWRGYRSYAFGPSNAINLYSNNDREWLLSPTFDLTSGGPFQLEINVAVTNWNSTTADDSMGSDDEVQLLITTDGGTTWNNLTTWNAANEPEVTGTEYTEDLSSYSGNVQFAIWASDGTIDDSEDYDFHVGKFKLGSLKDTDTQAKNPNSSIASNTIIASNVTTVATSTDAFSFIIEDLATSDFLPTNVTSMRFVPGLNNTADWTDHIQDITLYDENLVDYTPTTTITDTAIILDFDTPITIANGTALEFVLGFYLNTNNIVDESIIQFQIDAASNGFVADNNGSGFADPFSGTVIGENITLDVVATEIAFSEQPSNTYVNEIMTPDVTVAAIDTNGNIDVSYDLDIEITSTGSLIGSPITATAANGVATFAGLTHTVVDTGLVFTADDDLHPTTTSSAFDIEAIPVGPVVIAIQDFDGTTPEWTYTNEISFFDNTWGSDGFYGIINITSASPIDYENMQGNILGENDLDDEDDNGTSGFATTTFATIDISTYNNVELTFDWDVVGYNANNDDARYEVFFDGVGQGTVYLLDGDNSTETDEGTVTVLIPNTVSNVSLEIEIRNNGGGGFSGFDNFKLEGEMIPTSNTYTYNGTWSPSDPNGTTTANDIFAVTSGNAIIDTDTSVNNITVSAGATLTVNSGVTLTVGGADGLTLTSTSTSYSSLILDGSISGSIYYERHVNGNAGLGDTNAVGDNDLISPPLSGETFSDFASANDSNLLANPSDPTEKAFALFNKTIGAYENYNTSTNVSTLLNAGTGFRAATSNTATLRFSGTVETADFPIDIIHSGPAYAEWNLIGNPYPSYITIEDLLNHVVGSEEGTDIKNIDLLNDTSGIYGYDGNEDNGWDVINLANAPGRLMTPGQGFFVAADADQVANFDFKFTTAMRTSGSSDDFIAGRTADVLTYLKVMAQTETNQYTTQLYFNSNASRGLDPGYDAKIWGGTVPSFALYSHLVEDNTGLPIALQSLNTTDLTDVTVPLGVHANQGETLTFNIDSAHLPESTLVYLEDTVTNTYTLLNTNDYILTPNSNITGTGRFYLHLSSNTLSLQDNAVTALNIYTNTADQTIVISGQINDKTTATIYDMQGRIVVQHTLNSNETVQTLDTKHMVKGIYVIDLSNKTQSKTQKIIIN